MRKIPGAARPNTVTVYNYLGTTAGVAAYQRTQLGRVYFDSSYQQRLAGRGVTTQDTARLLVELRDVDVTAGRTFVLPSAWAHLTVEEKAAHFTFNTANDFIIGEACSDELPPATKAALQSDHRVLGISSVSTIGTTVLEVIGK